MSDYLDNQKSWEWHVDDKAKITVNHGNHTHTLDLTDIEIGDMADNMNLELGNAHRRAPHNYINKTGVKESNKIMSDFLDSLRVDKQTQENLNAVSKRYAEQSQTAQKVDNGGRERGDEGPGSLGREAGNKTGEQSNVSSAQSGAAAPSIGNTDGTGGQSAGSTGGQSAGSTGGQSAGSTGGQSAGGTGHGR